MRTPPQRNVLVKPIGKEPTSIKSVLWREFCADDALLRAHNVKPHELETLSRIVMLGSVHSRADLLFMLSAMRRPRRR